MNKRGGLEDNLNRALGRMYVYFKCAVHTVVKKLTDRRFGDLNQKILKVGVLQYFRYDNSYFSPNYFEVWTLKARHES